MDQQESRGEEVVKHRGIGCVFARGELDDKGRLKSGSWWIRYYKNAKAFSESAHTLVKAQAEALLKKRIGEIASGDFVTPTDRRVTIEQVYQLLLDDYKMNDRATLEWAQRRWNKRLKAAFGDLKASQLTTESLNRFVLDCQSKGLSNCHDQSRHGSTETCIQSRLSLHPAQSFRGADLPAPQGISTSAGIR
jgi:hypothetical protein